MASDGAEKPKKRSKAFYKKMAYGNKKSSGDKTQNLLLPGIRGFLVTCNFDEKSAVRECYNILNEYADILYGPDKNAGLCQPHHATAADNMVDDDCEDVEKALKKEVEELMKASGTPEKRFQNVLTKAKNCVFIRTSLDNPIEVTTSIMEDIAQKQLKKARYAARILPIIGTCRANSKDIEKLSAEVLPLVFSKESENCPKSYTILFKMRNNNGTSCGRESVIPLVKNVVKELNPSVQFSWTEYSSAVVIEVVCTVCCLGVAPDYFRLRKYNLQELSQGPKTYSQNSSQATLVLEKEVPEQSDPVLADIIKEKHIIEKDPKDGNVMLDNDSLVNSSTNTTNKETSCDQIEDCVILSNNDNTEDLTITEDMKKQ